MTKDEPGPLDAFLAGVAPDRAPVVRELHRSILEVAPGLDCAVKWRMLTYARGARWRTWVAAIDASTKQGVHLRFLYGTMLEAGQGVLRAGSSHLATLDLPAGAPVDADLVRRLVDEAVVRHDELVATTERR